MPKRSSKKADPNTAAYTLTRIISGEPEVRPTAEVIRFQKQHARAIKGIERILDREERQQQKNPAAVALGRLGGRVGGPARAAALSKRRRSEIAKKAATARWKAVKTAKKG